MSVKRTAVTVFILALILASTVYAQIRSATITGTVRDASQAPIPDAEVVVTQQETGTSTTLKTSEAGTYTAPYLAAGTYTVSVNASGFTPFKQTGTVLGVNQTV